MLPGKNANFSYILRCLGFPPMVKINQDAELQHPDSSLVQLILALHSDGWRGVPGSDL